MFRNPGARNSSIFEIIASNKASNHGTRVNLVAASSRMSEELRAPEIPDRHQRKLAVSAAVEVLFSAFHPRNQRNDRKDPSEPEDNVIYTVKNRCCVLEPWHLGNSHSDQRIHAHESQNKHCADKFSAARFQNAILTLPIAALLLHTWLMQSNERVLNRKNGLL